MEREQVFQNIIRQIGNGHQEDYENLIDEIDRREEKKLNEEYQSKIDSLGENPIDEPEIAKIIEESTKGERSQFDIAAHILGKDFIKATDMEQIALLIAKAIEKVISYKDKDGVLKKTKSFESYEPMKPVDRMNYENLILKAKKTNNEKDLKDLEAKRDKFIAEKTNIDVENLTSWEKNLLQEILAQEAKSISMIFLGKK